MILLLALMLVVGGAKVFSAQGVIDEKGHLRQDDGHHPDYGHSHHQALPLLEMLPPIGPIGIVAIVVVADMNYFSPDDAELAQKPKPARARPSVPLEVRQTQRAPIPPTPQTNTAIPSKRDP